MKRDEILDAAKKIVTGREEKHGNTEDNFQAIANMWTQYFISRGIIRPDDVSGIYNGLVSSDVAAMMIMLKIARIASGNAEADSWVDIAGYAACGGEIYGE